MSKRRKVIRRKLCDPLIGIVINVTTFIIGLIPFSMLIHIARFWRILSTPFLTKHNKLIHANLAIAFPDKSDYYYKKLAKTNITNSLLFMLHILWFIKNPTKLKNKIPLSKELKKNLQKYKDKPETLLLITPHLGCWELLGQTVTAHGFTLNAVATPLRNTYLHNLINSARKYQGINIIPQTGAVKKLLKVIKKNENVAMLMDQNTRPREGGIFGDFFGLPVATTRAPAMFAKKWKLKIITAACVFDKGEFKIIVAPKNINLDQYSSDESLTTAILQQNEVLVRQYPEHYAWIYKRWRYQPDDITEEQKQKYPYYVKRD